MGIDKDWLEEKVLMRKMDDSEIEMLKKLVDVAEFKTGDTIMEQGNNAGILYTLRSGTAKISCSNNGEEVRLAVIDETSLFGEMSFLTGEAASATVTAKTDCVVYSLTRAAYSELMQKNQDIVFALFTHLLVHAGNVIRKMNKEQLALQQYISGRRV